MCKYTNVHARGKESEDFVMQKGTTSAQAPQKELIKMDECGTIALSGDELKF